MSTFLDTLKLRLTEAQRRHQEVAGRLQRVQVEFQAATQQLQSWQIAVQTEAAREQAEAAAVAAQAQAASQPHEQQHTPQQQPLLATPAQTIVVPVGDNQPSSDVNKTEIIRDQLRQHPAGMTGKELWDAVKAQISHRPYVYSVLKRLRDKEEVVVRRKKYRLVPKPEDTETHAVQ